MLTREILLREFLFCADDRLCELHEFLSKVEHGRQGQVVSSFLESSRTILIIFLPIKELPLLSLPSVLMTDADFPSLEDKCIGDLGFPREYANKRVQFCCSLQQNCE